MLTERVKEIYHEIEQFEVATKEQLEQYRQRFVGRKGAVEALFEGLKDIVKEERRAVGQELNALKNYANDRFLAIQADFEANDNGSGGAPVDLTLPVVPNQLGSIHPLTLARAKIIEIFERMGFSVADGPEIESDWYNFTALNFPENHPAREMHDTFFMKPAADGSRKLLRTHASPIQVRAMLANKPPIRVIAPGRVYRKDWDATHTPMFHQIEGLVIDDKVHMGHLKSCLTEAFSRFFEVPTTESRFRPHFFPFTEPSAEMDIRCDRSGAEIKVGEGNDWLEILGCGMVHPNVLRSCNIDPEQYQGFAFGLGVDRLAMLKYGMPDLRPYFEADIEWIKHYGFKPWLLPTVTGGLS